MRICRVLERAVSKLDLKVADLPHAVFQRRIEHFWDDCAFALKGAWVCIPHRPAIFVPIRLWSDLFEGAIDVA